MTSSNHLSFMTPIKIDKCLFSDIFDTVYSILLSSKLNSNNKPTYHQAMNVPNQDNDSDDINVEMITLKDKMNA